MNPDRWKVVKGLFQRALALPPNDRAAYLDRVSAGDRELRHEVASLVAEHEANAQPQVTPPSSQDVTLELGRVRSSNPSVEPVTLVEDPTDG